MSSSQTFVIVGASLAGAKAAETLRTEGFDGHVVLLGEEPERPYERPPLSKDYLRGESEREKVYVHKEGFYAEADIDLTTEKHVVAVHPGQSCVELDDGRRVRYDRLLLTTGATPRRLPVPGAGLDGVLYLRSLAQSDDLARAFLAAEHVAIIGAGWIGSEVAASARQLGRDVTVIEAAALPLEHVLGAEVGAIYRDLHTSHGVDMRLGASVEALDGDGHVSAVRLSDGSSVPADLVVVGVGVAPRVELAVEAGLKVDNGVVVDANLRTSVPNIFAAGDVASAFHPGLKTQVRVEHWANALNQGPAAARNMLDRDEPYDRVPYFFSDQYDLGMEYSGYATSWDRVVFRGRPADGAFIAFWLQGDTVVAGMNANVWDVTDPIQRLIRERFGVDADRLADPDTPLEALLDEGIRP